MVADDLTGAADAAVHFLRPGEEILLVSPAGKGGGLGAGTAGVAIDTRTRRASSAQAVVALEQAAGLVRRLRPALIYKKLDSQLRGNPGLEIETLRRELGRRCALVAPAHPDEHRVTRGGVHFVHGVPVAEAEPGHDPVAPVTESRLSALLAGQAGVQVAHVVLADMEGGASCLHRVIERVLAEGHPIITFDAVCPQDLDLIAEVASTRFRDALLAGSAGLAIALAGHLRGGAAPARPAAAPECESILFVCGSTAGALRRQVDRLLASARCGSVTVTPPSVLDERRREALVNEAAQAPGLDVLLQTPGHRLDAGACDPSTLLAGLAAVASAVAARRRPAGVFLSGGDTAAAVLSAAGVKAVRLRGEAMPGIACGVAVGGTLDGATIMTRSGAFGGDEDLVELRRRCGKGETHG